MKKRIFLLLALTAALLLALGMSTAMATMTSPVDHSHYALCDNPTVCAVCGIAYSGSSIRHDFDWDNLQFDETSHWASCTRCNLKVGSSGHRANCDNLTVCNTCGAPYSGDSIDHDWGDYQYDETEHWRSCTRCSVELYRGDHVAYCDNPNVCIRCGAAYFGDNIYHPDQEFKYNEEEHWLVCTRCSLQLADSQAHWADCGNPTVCGVCGAPYSGNDIQHRYGTVVGYDENEHWLYCPQCGGNEQDRGEHYAWCNEPGVCGYCHAPYSGNNIRHEGKYYEVESGTYGEFYPYKYNETEHWEVCARCDAEMGSRSKHWAYCDNPNVCARCGAPYSGSDIRHETNPCQYNDTEHWQTCTRCKEELMREEHWSYCDARGVCGLCGTTYAEDGDRVVHSRDVTLGYQHNETHHWYLCGGCGEKVAVEKHSFDANGKCTSCDYQSVSGEVTDTPTDAPTDTPTDVPTDAPTDVPTDAPTDVPTDAPTDVPTDTPTDVPTDVPTDTPTDVPTEVPTDTPTDAPTDVPTDTPTDVPTETPTDTPTDVPTEVPTDTPTDVPTETPTDTPTDVPTETPTDAPTDVPTTEPTDAPTDVPTEAPTDVPTAVPTDVPTAVPTDVPTAVPTDVPTFVPTDAPTAVPTTVPTDAPTAVPTTVPTDAPTAMPAEKPAEPVILADAVIEPSEGTALPEGMTLIVADVTAIEPVVVNNTEAVFVFTVAVQGDENAQTLPAAVRITLPLDIDLTGLRLVLIQEDGTETEIAFEVVEGKLVFETALTGTFALVPIQN